MKAHTRRPIEKFDLVGINECWTFHDRIGDNRIIIRFKDKYSEHSDAAKGC